MVAQAQATLVEGRVGALRAAGLEAKVEVVEESRATAVVAERTVVPEEKVGATAVAETAGAGPGVAKVAMGATEVSEKVG